MREFYQNLIRKIGDSPYQSIIAINGGGVEAISELVKYNSKILLEATLAYNDSSLIELIGGNPESYCSLEVARNMAAASFQRCLQLCEDEFKTNQNLIGLGACSSLDKREVYVAFMTPHKMQAWKLIMRTPTESLIAEGILTMLAKACQVPISEIGVMGHESLWNKTTMSTLARSVEYVLYTKSPFAVKYSIGEKKQGQPKIFFPGSFNPIHEGHIAIAEFVYNFNKQTHPINFEISINNTNKPIIDYFHIHKRENKICEKLKDKKWAGNIYFTNMPRLFDKAKHFKNSQFIIGIDSLIRMGHCYEEGKRERDITIDLMCNKYNAHFFCFPRKIMGRLVSQKDLPQDFPKTLLNNTVFAPENISIETSSTEIRKHEEF